MTTVPDTPGCWPLDTSCAPGWDELDPAVQERASLLAVETLRMLTGYRVGGCPIRVRPCRAACAPPSTWQVYPAPRTGGWGGWWGVSSWAPVIRGGEWYNVPCGCAPQQCSCGRLCEIQFPGGIGAVVEVKQDGAVLDESAYRIDNGMLLVRLDGECWPVCQTMTNDPDATDPADAAGTLVITYIAGSLPGRLGAIAAGALAAEYAKACAGQTCALPPRARTVARQGVTIDLASDTGDTWPGGMTGIREADLFIRRHNPYALRTPSAVWSPDLPAPRRVR